MINEVKPIELTSSKRGKVVSVHEAGVSTHQIVLSENTARITVRDTLKRECEHDTN